MLVNDGRLQFTVTGVDTGIIETRVDVGGPISDRKGVMFPMSALISPPDRKGQR